MLKEVRVSGLSIDPITHTPIVLLKDKESHEVIPIWIGLLEASSIATQLENIKLARPMTHDLMKNILDHLDVVVSKVEVNDLRNNTFFATIHLNWNGVDLAMDARPSDAIAIALRTKSPIFVHDKVIEKSRKIDLTQREEGEDVSDEKLEEILKELSPEDFGKYKM
ncbi:MAG: bifunctional nuclease family protein [Deltaproteobacteria bacterium]|nr:bifunctional nuclease family protein [Deltaproteobacteria bacterium]